MQQTFSKGVWPLWPYSLILSLALFIAGCSNGDSHTKVQSSTSPTLAPTVTVTTPPQNFTIQQAWGNAKIMSFPSKKGGVYQFLNVNCATPDGRYIVGNLKPDDFAKPTHLPSFLALYDLQTAQVIKIHQLAQTTSQVLSAAADVNWIAWVETPDAVNLTNWTLAVYNRQTGAIGTIAQQARDNQGNLLQSPSPNISIDHGILVWDDVDVTASTSTNSIPAVKMRDLATGKVTIVGSNIFQPQLTWPWLSWSQKQSDGSGTVTYKNLESNSTFQVKAQPVAEATYGTSFVYEETGLKSIQLISDVTKSTAPQTLIRTSEQGEYYQFPMINSRLIGWTAYNSTQVWDRVLGAFVTLPTTYRKTQVFVTIAGPLLIWTDNPSPTQIASAQSTGQEAPLTYYVIDTRTLPTTAP